MCSEYIYGSTADSEYYACKVTGASHLRAQTACQDAYEAICLSRDDDKVNFLAIADGHGSAKHDLSEHGSRLAVKAAIEVMQDLHHKLVSVPGELARSFKQDLPRRVVRRWQHYVRDDAESRGIPVPEEMDKLRELYSRYGTTLLVALCTSTMILLGQIGDGNMMLINAKGHAEMLFANRSDELVGNATFSLCSDQSHLLWLTAQRSVEGKPTLLLMSTDGLSNSFDSDQSYQAFAVSLWESIRAKSVHAFRDYFPGMLRDFTERGSGDDITMALRFFAEPHIDSNRSAKEGD